MGRHRHKKVTEKEAEDSLTQQLVESGKREELKAMVGCSGHCPLDSSLA